MNIKLKRSLSILVLGLLGLPGLTGCTGLFNTKLFKERAAETPAPNEQIIDKSFFVDPSGKPKTFLCAMAPIIGRGFGGERETLPGVNDSPHCNVEFEITENLLVGKLVNPSFLNDRSRWASFIRIPISKHFYYERAKDEHGRETNTWIENESRSHWSARPKMKISLAGTQFGDATSGSTKDSAQPGSYQITSVQDVEWDLANNFLGFSINAVYAGSEGQINGYQGEWRINFLKFEHDETFKKVAYNQENAKFINIIHVMGRMVDGVEPELYAAHWDLRKTTRVYLSGVPKEQQQTVANAIHRWNTELRNVGAIGQDHLAFTPVIKELKYPFDLRYSSITWISDRRISMHAPLGIGMAHADVRNGKILWGGVVLFGGMLERYINAYSPTESDSGGSSSAASGPTVSSISPLESLTAMLPTSMPMVPVLDNANNFDRSELTQNMSVDHKNFLNQEMAALAKSKDQTDQSKIEALKAQLQNMQSQDPKINEIVADVISSTRSENLKVTEFFKKTDVQSLLGTTNSGVKTTSLLERAKSAGDARLAKALQENNLNKRAQMLQSLVANGSSTFVEKDLTIENKLGGWNSSPAQKLRTYPQMLESVVMSLSVHEFGHFIGLGHQFKENIVPESGTVPEKYVKDQAAKATAKAEFSNFTSVMGYQSGRTEMMIEAKDVKPGPHDSLVLQYLYNGKYPTFEKGQSDFTFRDIPESGRIPEFTKVDGKQVRTAYFPACNDIEASLGADPFCNRWDRGSSAVDIVNSYFDLMNDNLLTNLYSLAGGSGDSYSAENRMWYVALDNFSRTRMFYDEMRRRLRSEPHLKPLWNQLRTDKDGLFEFSKACMQADPTDPKQVNSETLRAIFADKKIVDLCRANFAVLEEFRFFLNLPESDYTKIDHNNRYVSSGYLAGDVIQSYSHIFGSWYQLSNLALKISAMYTLTSANSYILWGGITHNPYYDNEENRFLYRTLYPSKYTKLIADTVQNNMRFAATGKDDTTTIGRTVLATGSYIPWQRVTSNDSARLPREYNDLLDQQTQFKFSMVAILVDAATPDANSNIEADRYKKFTATVYDFVTSKSTSTRDVFLLPKGDIFVWANGMFLYPVTKLKFYKGTSAYVIAYKVDYDDGVKDELINDSLKYALMEKHNAIGSVCVNGFGGNGLLNYFDTANTDFAGFKILSGIAEEKGKEKLTAFYTSLEEEFDKYEKKQSVKDAIPKGFPLHSMRRICDEAIRGVGQISAAAALANGYWLGITSDYLEK